MSKNTKRQTDTEYTGFADKASALCHHSSMV